MENLSKMHFADSDTPFDTPIAGNGTKRESVVTTNPATAVGDARHYANAIRGHSAFVRELPLPFTLA